MHTIKRAIVKSKVKWMVKVFLPFYLFTFSLFSCGDYWEAGDPKSAGTMTLARDTIDLMVGDSFKIPVTFSPDSLSNSEVWWDMDDEEIVTFRNDTIVAMQQGSTRVTATSVSDRLTSSCIVNVWPRWYDNPHRYPYDMVIYANITIDGEPIGDNVFVGAFINNELRGVARTTELNGHRYTVIRVWSENYTSYIRFRHYDPLTATMVEHDFTTFFIAHDTFGTPANPYDLELN